MQLLRDVGGETIEDQNLIIYSEASSESDNYADFLLIVGSMAGSSSPVFYGVDGGGNPRIYCLPSPGVAIRWQGTSLPMSFSGDFPDAVELSSRPAVV